MSLKTRFRSGSAERREKTLRRVTDLFVFGSSHFSGDHIAVFDGVFSHLVADIEQSARAALADRLAALPNAPPTVDPHARVRRRHRGGGPRPDAIGAARQRLAGRERQDQEPVSICSRSRSGRSLAETVTDVLVERGGRDVALSVAQNAGAKFSEAGYVRLVKRSEHDDELARSVGSRPEIPRHHFLKLLSTASKAVRMALEGAHPEHAGADQAGRRQGRDRDPGKGGGYVTGLCGGARTRRDAAGVRRARRKPSCEVRSGRQLRGYGGRACRPCPTLPIDVVERVLVQDRAETILIVAKSMELSWPTVRALAAAAGRKGRPVHPGARAAYDELHAAEARDRAAGDRVPAKTPSGGMTPRACGELAPTRRLFGFPRALALASSTTRRRPLVISGTWSGRRWRYWLGSRQQQRIHMAIDHVLVIGRAGLDRIEYVAEVVRDERDKLVAHGGADVPQLAGGLMRPLQRGWRLPGLA